MRCQAFCRVTAPVSNAFLCCQDGLSLWDFMILVNQTVPDKVDPIVSRELPDMRILAVIPLIAMFGCASSAKELAFPPSMNCLQLADSHQLYRTDLSPRYSRAFSLVPEQGIAAHQRGFQGGYLEVVDVLPAGTKVSVDSVRLHQKHYHFDPYLRMVVTIQEGPLKGQQVEVPTFAPFHPVKKWLLSTTTDPKAIEFNPAYVRPCANQR